LILALFAGLSHGAGASRKTDIITLYNGDKVTGEIKHLFAGLLEVSTNAMGTVKIEWQEISRLESMYHHEIRLATGRRYYGKIELSTRVGEIKISDLEGEHEVSALEIVEIRPVAKSFKDRIDVYLSAGFSYTNASSVGETNFNTDISYVTEKTRNSLSGRLIITDTEDSVTRSSKVDLSRSVWTHREDTYRVLLAGYETNDELSLDHRYSFGGGLGRHFIDTNRSSWTGAIGLQVLTEESLDGDSQESVEGFLNSGFSTWKFDTPELNMKLNGSLFPSLTESGRYRANLDANIRWEIIEDLFWDITAFGTYDNKAPSDSRFDYGVTTGVGWTY